MKEVARKFCSSVQSRQSAFESQSTDSVRVSNAYQHQFGDVKKRNGTRYQGTTRLLQESSYGYGNLSVLVQMARETHVMDA